MKYLAIALLCCPAWLSWGQQPVTLAPPADTSPSDTVGGYTVMQSFETGYRAVTVSGNGSSYRSQVNFGNGLRLFDSDIEAASKDGHGRYFDQFSFKAQGLGNDPYESVGLHIEKNGWYDYTFHWRLSDYFNPGLTTANGVDAENLQHRSQDHDLILLPHSRVRFLLGFSRSSEDGTALTSFLNYDLGTDPLFSKVRWTQDEYRFGVDAKLAGWRVNLLHDWEFFRDDTEVSSTAPPLTRTQPDHGETSGWRGFVTRDFGHTLSFNGRMTYQGTGRGSLVTEESFNTLPSTGPAQQVVVSGEASRPVTAANTNLVWSPIEQFSLDNETSFSQVQINGNANSYQQFDPGTLSSVVFHFQYFGIRDIADRLTAKYRVRKWLGLSLGYEFSSRRFRSVASSTDGSDPAAGSYGQSSQLHAVTAGLHGRLGQRLSFQASGELGRNSLPIYPVSDKHYQAFHSRLQYRAGSLLLAATASQESNLNSVSISSFASHSRSYGAEGDWSPRSWMTLTASWSKLHLNTDGGLLYFVDSALVTGSQSVYISNLHFVNLGARFEAGARVKIYLGYSRVQDLGDGRSTPEGNGVNAVEAFNIAQTYPLLYDTPMARVTVPISARLRWNAGWQYYRYAEQFFRVRDYHANGAFTSIGWSF